MLSNYPKIRLAAYIIGIGAQVASFFVAIVSPVLADAFSKTSDVLGVIALATAATNVSDFSGDDADI